MATKAKKGTQVPKSTKVPAHRPGRVPMGQQQPVDAMCKSGQCIPGGPVTCPM